MWITAYSQTVNLSQRPTIYCECFHDNNTIRSLKLTKYVDLHITKM